MSFQYSYLENFTETNKYDTDLNFTNAVTTHAEVAANSRVGFSQLMERVRGGSFSGCSVQNSKSVW